MKQVLKRVTLSGSSYTKIEFTTKSGYWQVSNFSSTVPVIATFDNSVNDDEAFKIPANYSKTLVINENRSGLNAWKTDAIWVKGDGAEIEVQQLCFE